MAGYSGDPGDFTLSMANLHLHGRFTRASVNHPHPVNRPHRLPSSTETVTIKVGGRTTGNKGHNKIMYLNHNLSDRSITTSGLFTNLDFYSVGVSGDKLIISGGYDNNQTKSTAEVHQFCFASKKWQQLNPMPRPRDRHNSAVLNHLMIILAGWYEESGKSNKYYKEVYALNLRTGAWTVKKECPIAVWCASIATVNGDVYLIGGITENLMSKRTYKFSLQNNEWTECGDIPASKAGAVNCNSTVALGYNIYVLAFDDFFVYNIQRNQWSVLSVPILPSYCCSLVHKDNTLVMMGGFEDTHENPHNRIQCYDLQTKEWSLISDTLPLPLAFHTVVVMELPTP